MRVPTISLASLVLGQALLLCPALVGQVIPSKETVYENGGATAPETNSGGFITNNVPADGTAGRTGATAVNKWSANSGQSQNPRPRPKPKPTSPKPTSGTSKPVPSSRPPVWLTRVSLSISPSSISTSGTAQASVTGVYSDNSRPNLTHDSGTTYFVGHPRSVSVSSSGGVTAKKSGSTFVTAKNSGRSGRARVTVEASVSSKTTLRGSVYYSDGKRAHGASVLVVGGTTPTVTTNILGGYSIPGVPSDNKLIYLRATQTLGGVKLTGTSSRFKPSQSSFTRVGRITLTIPTSAVAIHDGDVIPCLGAGNSKLSVLNASSTTPIRTVSLGQEAFYIAISANNKTAMVSGACPQNPQIDFYDLGAKPPALLASIPAPFANATIETTRNDFAILAGEPHGIGTIVSVDMTTRSIVNAITFPGPVESIALTPNGLFGVAVGIGQDLRIFAISNTGALSDTGNSASIPNSGGLTSATFSPDGRLLLVGGLDGSVHSFRFSGGFLLNRSTSAVLRPNSTHMVQAVRFGPGSGTGYVLLGDPFGASQREIVTLSFDTDGFLDSGLTRIAALDPGLPIRGEGFAVVDGGSSLLLTAKDRVSVIDPSTGVVVRTITTPGAGRGIAH